MSVKVKQEWGKQRAVWSLEEEQVLMDLVDKARHDPDMRTKKGLRPRGWDAVAEEVNNRCKSAFNADQLKSKYSRLMMDYELFEDVGGERSLTDEAWDKVIQSMPENEKRLAQFKESGFPHADICRRIALGKEELPDPRPWASSVVAAKRPSPSDEEELAPEAKKARKKVEMETDGWGAREEKLLMFLCWRAKKDQEKFIEEGTEPWLEVTNELNKHSKTNFDEEDVKSKYLQVMQDYEQFKRTTGFTGDAGTAPRYKKDWDLLIKERPECAGELEKLRAKGGFPHVEVCSVIKGDKATDDTEPASVTEYLAKGKLQHVKAAKALPYILPATASTTTALKPPAAQSEPAVGTAAAGAGAAPAAFTQELHDNLNMFLKTATAYLVMLIDDHNKGSGM